MMTTTTATTHLLDVVAVLAMRMLKTRSALPPTFRLDGAARAAE